MKSKMKNSEYTSKRNTNKKNYTVATTASSNYTNSAAPPKETIKMNTHLRHKILIS